MIDDAAEQLNKQVDEARAKGNGSKAARFALACLGALPGIGGAIAGVAATWSEAEQAEYNRIFSAWLKLQEDEIGEIVTRQEIWASIHGQAVREDSADADLFKLLIHDLSTGHVVRQHRQVDYYGNFVKAQPKKRQPGTVNRIMGSAFDDEKEYELTELGKQFVHYTMTEIVPRIAGGDPMGPVDAGELTPDLDRGAEAP